MFSWIAQEADLLPGDMLAGATRATVLAGGAETAYFQLGRGAPLLFLRGNGDHPPISAALIRSLVERFSLIVPRTIAALQPAASSDVLHARLVFSAWLRDFLDGLGIERASIIADLELGLPALAFAMTLPQRVSRLAVLVMNPPGFANSADLVTDRLQNAGCPLLIVCVGPAPGGIPEQARWERTITKIGAFFHQGTTQHAD